MATTVTRWSPTTHADDDLLKGKDVYSADGEEVGMVNQVFYPEGDVAAPRGRRYFLLDPGLLRKWFGGFSDVYLPESAIAGATADRVELTFTTDQVKSQGWTTTKPARFDRYRRA